MYSFYVVRKFKGTYNAKKTWGMIFICHFVYLDFEADGSNLKSILFC